MGKGILWWLIWYRICLQCSIPGFDPWVGKIPWRRKWQPTPVFSPRESHGQRRLVGYSPWDCKELDTTEWLKEISPGCSLEGMMLKLKLLYFGHLMRRVDSLEKTLMPGGFRGGGEGDNRGWDGWKSLGEFLGVGDGQGGLACCSSWGHKESDTTEQLNWSELRLQGLKWKGSVLSTIC